MWPVIRTALQRPQIIVVLALLLLVTDALLAIFSPVSAAGYPDRLHPADFPGTEMLLEAPHDDDDWLLPAKTYAGNRYTGLLQIDKSNVGTLRMAWETSLADDGEQEAAPLVWNGTMYLSTPHDGVLALDASNGKLRWQTPYNPKYVLLYAPGRFSRDLCRSSQDSHFKNQECGIPRGRTILKSRTWFRPSPN